MVVGLIDEFSDADSGTVGSVKKLVLQLRLVPGCGYLVHSLKKWDVTKDVEPNQQN